MSPATDQPARALAKANEIRFARALDKRQLAELDGEQGRRRAVEILLDPPVHWRKATLRYLLKSLPGVGSSKVNRWLREARIYRYTSGYTQLDQFTIREREALRQVILRAPPTKDRP